jgi:hypothetical protein
MADEFSYFPVEEGNNEYWEEDDSDHIPSDLTIDYHPGRKGFYHFEEYDNHKTNIGDESTVLQNNDERLEDDKDDEEDKFDRPTGNIHITPSDHIASIGTWITSDETGLVQLCYIVGEKI